MAPDGPRPARPYAVGQVKKALRRILAATFLDGEPPSCSAVACAMGFPSMERRLRGWVKAMLDAVECQRCSMWVTRDTKCSCCGLLSNTRALRQSVRVNAHARLNTKADSDSEDST